MMEREGWRWKIVEGLNDGNAFEWCYFEPLLVSLSMYRVIFFVDRESALKLNVEREASWACFARAADT